MMAVDWPAQPKTRNCALSTLTLEILFRSAACVFADILWLCADARSHVTVQWGGGGGGGGGVMAKSISFYWIICINNLYRAEVTFPYHTQFDDLELVQGHKQLDNKNAD